MHRSPNRDRNAYITRSLVCATTPVGASQRVLQIRLVGRPLTKPGVLQLDEKNDRRGDEVRSLSCGSDYCTLKPVLLRYSRGNSHGWSEKGYFITLALLKEAADVGLWSRERKGKLVNDG